MMPEAGNPVSGRSRTPVHRGRAAIPIPGREDSVKKLALLVIAVALVVAGGASARSQATKVEIGAAMAAAAEVPAPKGDVGSATGTFTATLTKSDSGTALSWQLTFSSLTGPGTAAHIHIGEPGKPGPVVVPLCSPCTSGATGTANVNATVLEAIQNGNAYVNVHTRTNPAGEIRGQVSSVASVKVAMRASQERPKPKGKVRRARGTFTATVTKSGSSAVVSWRLTFSRLTGKAIAAHIHSGRRGVAGPVIVPLCAPCRSGQSGKATVNASVLTVLESGRAYVNVHTRKNPAGEIRGQLPAVPLVIT
jgi:CHRD domain